MIIVFMVLSLSLSMLFLFMNFFLSEYFMEQKTTNSSFECGMENNNLTRVPFSLQFFLIGLIFIIFDLEVIILLNFLPFTYCLTVVFLMMFFMCFVFFSLLYEWKFNKLLWMK